LKGHQSIGVIVEELTSEIENKGITRAQIQADVELALRKAGIKVDNNSPSALYLNASIMRTKTSEGIEIGLAYDIQLSFQQPATLSVNKSIDIVTTWNKGVLATTGRDNFRAIRDDINDYVSQFINDFLAANQK
jgi:hypothetical protein